MQSGRLRHLVELWEYHETADKYGEPIKDYTKIGEAFAEIRPLLGRESFAEKMENTLQTHKILTRFIPTPIDSTMQIRYNGRVFEVIGNPINWMERGIFLQFNCMEQFDHDKVH